VLLLVPALVCCLFCQKFYEIMSSSKKCFVDTKKVLKMCFVAMNKVRNRSVKCVVGDVAYFPLPVQLVVVEGDCIFPLELEFSNE
jgi:hypothetical protein